MSVAQRIGNELKVVLLTTCYFAIWFVFLMLLKKLVLEQYQIQFRGLSFALVGALVVAKVVLVMEHVSLGQWVRKHPAAIDVVLRTLLYTLGAFLVMLIEKAIEARHEYGGFFPAMTNIMHHRDIPHVWVNTICVGWALLVFNALAVVRKHLGTRRMVGLYLAPPASEPKHSDNTAL